jgi:hypothetical protein
LNENIDIPSRDSRHPPTKTPTHRVSCQRLGIHVYPLPHESGHIVSPHVCMVLLYPIFASRSQSTGECFVALLLALEVWNESWFNVRKGKTSEAIKETARRWHRQLSYSSMRWLDGVGQRNSPGRLASCAYL